ncbi:MAG: methyltransferase [Anaerolineae bacterium]
MPDKKKQAPALPPLVECRLEERVFKIAPLPGTDHQPCPTMAEMLIVRQAEVNKGDRVLVMPAGTGFLASWAASRTPADHVLAFDTSLVNVQAAQRTLAANRQERVITSAAVPEPSLEPFDAVLMTLPKGRGLARLLILAAARVLTPGGRFYLAGANKAGIKSIAADAAQLLGEQEVLFFKGGSRVVRYIRPEVLPDELPSIYQEPGIAAGTYHMLQVALDGHEYALATRPGVFSWRELDTGTLRLIEHLPVHPYDNALDLGCGYGILGLWIAQHAARGSATLVDADILALECARRNLAALGIENAAVQLSDGLEGLPGKRFTLIASNPPFHSGLEVSSATTERWLRLAYEHLEPRGRLVIVANRFLPYERVLNEVFGASEILWEDTRFRVMQAVKEYRKERRGGSASDEEDWDDESENEAIRQAAKR